MPIYNYRCHTCHVDEDLLLKVSEMDLPQTHSCGSVMERVMSIPFRPIMRQTGNDMALNSLNSRDTRHMKPEAKQKAAAGLERPPKTIW